MNAQFWSALDDGSVRCKLCPHYCLIAEGKSGLCGIRENREGQLLALGYGVLSSIALDPIEKKPLYMFHPGKNILSIGGFSCNLKCPFCQNHEISMKTHKTLEGDAPMSKHRKAVPQCLICVAEDIVRIAVEYVPEKNIGIAYTYNEPLINYEFLADCAQRVRSAGLYNVLVTNGYINTEPLVRILPLIDAMNIDLKGFTDMFYKKVGGDIEHVRNTIELAYRHHCHLEITTLIIPGENEDDIEPIAKWIAEIDKNIPLHLSRFFPKFKYKEKKETSRETVLKCRDIARMYLSNVFCGNM